MKEEVEVRRTDSRVNTSWTKEGRNDGRVWDLPVCGERSVGI